MIEIRKSLFNMISGATLEANLENSASFSFC